MPLTDEQWQLLQPIFPPSPAAVHNRGRPLIDDRRVLDAILWKFAFGIPWYDLPGHYPSHQTCYRRYRQWRGTGQLWPGASAALQNDLRTRGGLDIQEALLNGDLALHIHGGKFTFTYPDHLRDTWQLKTASILLCLALQRNQGGKL